MQAVAHVIFICLNILACSSSSAPKPSEIPDMYFNIYTEQNLSDRGWKEFPMPVNRFHEGLETIFFYTEMEEYLTSRVAEDGEGWFCQSLFQQSPLGYVSLNFYTVVDTQGDTLRDASGGIRKQPAAVDMSVFKGGYVHLALYSSADTADFTLILENLSEEKSTYRLYYVKKENLWQTFEIPLKDFKTKDEKTIDLSELAVPFAIVSITSPMRYYLDDIYLYLPAK